jgi:hypothetical protein
MTAAWSSELKTRLVSRVQDANGAKKGRVLFLIDYALGGYRPVAVITYHVTGYKVLQVLAAGVAEHVLTTNVDTYIGILLMCADAVAIKTALRPRIEWLCTDEDEADDVCHMHEFTRGKRLRGGLVAVRRAIEPENDD